MGKFRKLTLEESKEQFELINDETQRALKGGGGNNGPTLLNDENSPNGLYSFNFLEEIQDNDPYPISPMSGDGSIWLDEVYVYGYYPHGNTPDYGVYCMTHHYYFPANRECYECQYSNDGGSYGYSNYYGSTYSYYGEYYGNYYGNEYTGHYGGGTSGGGSTGSSGGGSTGDLPSTVKFVSGSSAQIFETCFVECVTQTLITYGNSNIDINKTMAAIAAIIYNMPDKHAEYQDKSKVEIGMLLLKKGLHESANDYVLNVLFKTDKIKNGDALSIDKATNEGHVVMGNLTTGKNIKHAVVITDISGDMCTYYDPTDATMTKKVKLDKITELRKLSST